jgi:phosphoglycolate phosphatase-like HAD superfamily hydrolase
MSLASWRDTATREAIVAFAEGAAQDVPPEERVAVFDNDGTLWCEKPMPIELGFILQRLTEMAEQDESLRDKQPWKAAHEMDHAWLSGVITKHYAGDDTDVKVLMGGILQAFAGWTVDEYGAAAGTFVREAAHPTLERAFAACAYLPMIELLRYLESNGFTCYIASGGDRDFMRPVPVELYGIPSERVIGSSNALCAHPLCRRRQLAAPRYRADGGNRRFVGRRRRRSHLPGIGRVRPDDDHARAGRRHHRPRRRPPPPRLSRQPHLGAGAEGVHHRSRSRSSPGSCRNCSVSRRAKGTSSSSSGNC